MNAIRSRFLKKTGDAAVFSDTNYRLKTKDQDSIFLRRSVLNSSPTSAALKMAFNAR